jgi:acyl-CoA synthetase (AMP-forming)/AMP-acid ligase II
MTAPDTDVTPPMTNMADTISWHAGHQPWAVAIVENDAAIHYRTLEQMIWRAAWYLRQSGIASGDVVGIALPHSALYLVAVYALARIGAVSTALPKSDPPALRQSLAAKFGVKFVIALSSSGEPSGIPTIVLTSEGLGKAPSAVPASLRAEGGSKPWTIRRTSGTTNEAKGIEISHTCLLEEFRAQTAYFPGPRDRLIAMVPMSLTYGLHMCKRILFAGGCIVVPTSTTDPAIMFETIDRAAITWANLTPNAFDALLPLLPTEAQRAPHLRGLVASGMAMPDALRQAIRGRFSQALSIRYGSNEAGYLTAADAEMQARYPETVGRALPGVELQIVDDEDRPVAAGEAGHVRARTPWMTTGYVNAPAKPGQAFRNGWIYLGDIGVLSPEGMLFVKGRIDDMMNFDGIKIMPADIEDALLAHPAVTEAVAFPMASGRHQHLPAAAVIVRHDIQGDVLLAHCRERLGARSPVYLSIEQSFPRNPGGKVLRNELAGRLEQRLSRVAKP